MNLTRLGCFSNLVIFSSVLIDLIYFRSIMCMLLDMSKQLVYTFSGFYNNKTIYSNSCIISDSNNTSKTDHTWFSYRPMRDVNPAIEFLEFFCDGGTAVKQCGVRLLYDYEDENEDDVMEMNQIRKLDTRLSHPSPTVS